MTTIVRATNNDADLLVSIGTRSFLDSHGLSAPKADIDLFITLNFTATVFLEELKDHKTRYYIIYHNGIPAGYSKIIFDCTHKNIDGKNVTKLERLYLLKEYYQLKLGFELFHFNLQESIKQHQAGMWLFVWTENARAINFYNKVGFKIIGSNEFKISDTHYNPNHQMLLTY